MNRKPVTEPFIRKTWVFAFLYVSSDAAIEEILTLVNVSVTCYVTEEVLG
jgi:hypothetical protein